MSSLMKSRKTQKSNPGLLGKEHYISKSWVVAIWRYMKSWSYKIGSTYYICRFLSTRTQAQNFFLLLANVLEVLVDFYS